MQTVAPAGTRERIRPFLIAWAVVAIIVILAKLSAITGMQFPDPDDELRLQQVRDWLGGQSWWDVTQHRMNGPTGAPMHWSRLVDVPIAAVILMLRPLLGQADAELGALIIVPLLTLGVVMCLVGVLTRRLLDQEHAMIATLLVPVSILAMLQLSPLRIDHHGWQIALALAATVAALDPKSRASGLVAGAAAALWLHISLEGLPFAATLATMFAARWLLDPRQGERLTAFVGALALGSVAFYLATKAPTGWTNRYCDAVSPAYLAGFCVGAAVCWAVVRATPGAIWARVAALADAGVLAVGAMLWLAPHCARGPFEALDPLVHDFWYKNVLEGREIWHQPPQVAAMVIAFPLVGLLGSWRAFRLAPSEAARRNWAIMLFLLAGASLASVFVQRTGAVANLLALPGGVYLFRLFLKRASDTRSLPGRLTALIGAVVLVMPSYVVAFGMLPFSDDPPRRRAAPSESCVAREQLQLLDQLPPSTIAAPLDLSPAIIVDTHHSVIASGHHRNGRAMRDVIHVFTLPAPQAKAILDRRRIDYLVVCPTLVEPSIFLRYGPKGLWADLAAKRTPTWLEPVDLGRPSPLRVWKVKR